LVPAQWTAGTAIEFVLDLPAHVIQRPVRIRCRGTIVRVVPQEGGRIGVGATIDQYRFSRLRKASRSKEGGGQIGVREIA
jgi:hypothetical protein